jgi:glyoxylase-like metal-dependent hydrolase (beta-lactamase superfamily II)
MREVARGIWQLRGVPRDMFNIYLAGDVLIDAGTRWARGRVFRQLRRRRVSLVALTHCHPDHQGVAAAVCKQFSVPLACHEADVLTMEGRAPMGPRNWIIRLGERFWSGPPHPVDRVLRDGDELAGFRVVHTPGHTPGHVLFFRESDRVAIAGDVLANINFLTRKPGLREPPFFFSVDRMQNRRSVQTLINLRPNVVCFGHGPPLYDCRLLERLVERWQARTASVQASPRL